MQREVRPARSRSMLVPAAVGFAIWTLGVWAHAMLF